ncbi:hypothetical protein JST97_05640 [bacterium]|nr:hypothetical protein [bacterium]
MKKMFYAMVISLAVWGGASAQSMDRELAVLASTRSKLKNIATALEMWAADNEGRYPAQLQLLEGNYLQKIPLRVDGSTDWEYRVEENHFRLSDRWDGFARLGLPSRLTYDSETGLTNTPVSDELAPIHSRVRLKGSWLESRSDTGLSASWERFGTRITARLCGAQTMFESFEQQLARLKQAYPSWGYKVDPSELADRLVQVGTNGWKLEGVFNSTGEPWRRLLLLSKGERVLEISLEEHGPTRQALGHLADLHLLLAQL